MREHHLDRAAADLLAALSPEDRDVLAAHALRLALAEDASMRDRTYRATVQRILDDVAPTFSRSLLRLTRATQGIRRKLEGP